MSDRWIELLDKVRDTITPFEGTVIGVAVYAYGENLLQVQPYSCEANGSPSASVWIPRSRLRYVG
jgi:hypothetical protein